MTVRGTTAQLTPTEWGILAALATVPGRVYSRFELINKVRGYEFEGYERTIDSHVKNLRRKIEDDPGNPRIILTVLGGGYQLGLTRDDVTHPLSVRNTLRLRLALAFLGVALAALALLAVLAAVFSAADVSSLANQQRAELASAFAVAVGSSWGRPWAGPARTSHPSLTWPRAAASGSRWVTMAGRAVVTTGFGSAAEPGPGAQSSVPVLVQGRQVGTVLVGLTASGLGAADNVLRSRAAAGRRRDRSSRLLALVTGLVVARRITRPIARLITVARAMASGDRSARAGEVSRPGELRELAAAFDQMADTLDYEDKIRRDLVASVAHVARTPVAVLQAGHEALLDGVTEPSPAELGSLRDEVLRLARMVDDLQTMAAAAAAVLHSTRGPCDLAGIAGAAADSLARRFEAAEVTLDRQLATAPVVADERWIHQVVTNLLGNALNSRPRAAGSRLRTGQDGSSAVLTVEDTGVGIPADELPHVFNQFWRGQAAAQTSGSGIGLAIASQLALGPRRHAYCRHPAGGGNPPDPHLAPCLSSIASIVAGVHRRRKCADRRLQQGCDPSST